MRGTTALLLAGSLVAGAAAGPMRGPPRLGIDAEGVDRRVADLASALATSRAVRDQVAKGLSLEEAGSSLHRVEDGRYSGEALDAIAAAIDDAVARSGRRAADAPRAAPEATVLPKTGAVLVRLLYPAVAVSATEEREALGVSVWICPDRPTALALYFVRSGGRLSGAGEAEAPAATGGAFHYRLEGPGTLGEAAYAFGDGWQYNAPLGRDDPRAGGDRMGFLRGTVVVEATTWTYARSSPEAEWRTMGMLADNAREVQALLRSLDLFLVDRSAEP